MESVTKRSVVVVFRVVVWPPVFNSAYPSLAIKFAGDVELTPLWPINSVNR